MRPRYYHHRLDDAGFRRSGADANDSSARCQAKPLRTHHHVDGAHGEKNVIKARNAGVTEFLAKPFSAKALYGRILNIVANPRPFIKSKHYFGPDRRRTKGTNYTGPERRTSDSQRIVQPSLIAKAHT